MKRTPTFILTLLAFFYGQSFGLADLKWGLGGNIAQSFDDNVTYSKNRISDFITSLTLGTGLKQEGSKESLEVKGALTENIFASHSEFDNLAEDLSIKGRMDLNEYNHLSATESFNHSEDPRSFEDAFGRTSGRYSSYRNIFNMEYARELTQQWTARLNYSQTNYTYSRSDLSDANQYSPGLAAEYSLDSANQLLMGYVYSRFSFDPGQHATIHNISTGYRHYWTTQFYGEVKPGVNVIQTFNGKNLTKPRYEINLVNQADENTQLNASYVREYGANPFTQDIFNNWRISLSGFRQLTARIKGILSVFYGKGEYTTIHITDRLTGASVGGEYSLTEHTSINLNYSFQSTDSNGSNRSYSKNTVLLGLKFLF